MVALLRSVGVPSRTVSGVLVPGTRTAFAHAWVEYFVPAVGWVPADPYLGDEPFLPDAPEVDEPRVFYLGNLDSTRVTFSRGLDDYDPGVLSGVRFTPAVPFSRQALFAQAGAGLADVDFALTIPKPVGLFRLD
jgi:transglutaminase-like putative cysteine protease